MWCKLVTLLIAVGASAVNAQQRGELLADEAKSLNVVQSVKLKGNLPLSSDRQLLN